MFRPKIASNCVRRTLIEYFLSSGKFERARREQAFRLLNIATIARSRRSSRSLASADRSKMVTCWTSRKARSKFLSCVFSSP